MSHDAAVLSRYVLLAKKEVVRAAQGSPGRRQGVHQGTWRLRRWHEVSAVLRVRATASAPVMKRTTRYPSPATPPAAESVDLAPAYPTACLIFRLTHSALVTSINGQALTGALECCCIVCAAYNCPARTSLCILLMHILGRFPRIGILPSASAHNEATHSANGRSLRGPPSGIDGKRSNRTDVWCA